MIEDAESGRWDSNPRHLAWEASALPTELRPRAQDSSHPAGIGLRLRHHLNAISSGRERAQAGAERVVGTADERPRRDYSEYPSVTSPLCAANAARTSSFSRSTTLRSRAFARAQPRPRRTRQERSSVRGGLLPGRAECFLVSWLHIAEGHRRRCRPRGCASIPGPEVFPDSLMHFFRAGFSDVWPTMGFLTIASLK